MDKINAPDVIFHLGTGAETRGVQELDKYMGELFDAVPDLHASIEDIFAEGGKWRFAYVLDRRIKIEYTLVLWLRPFYLSLLLRRCWASS
jgi:hypothetical protein